jgi:chromosome segregation ATPase
VGTHVSAAASLTSAGSLRAVLLRTRPTGTRRAVDDVRVVKEPGMSPTREMISQQITTLSQSMSEGFATIHQRLEKFDKRFEQVDQRFAQIDERFEQVDQRFAQIDQRFEQVDQRFAQIDQRFAQVDERFTKIQRELTERIDDVETRLSVKIEVLAEEIKIGFDGINGLVERNARFRVTQAKHTIRLDDHEARILALESARTRPDV